MAKAMEIEIVNRETILPSSQTPQNLKTFKLSLFDQLTPAVYISFTLFYTSKVGQVNVRDQYLQKLKRSLSETLNHFYPLAGRMKDEVSIDCNDEGAEFIEAQGNFQISEILNHPDAEKLKQILPKEVESTETASRRLLLVQATMFECGGLAIGVSMSHKLADAATLSTFLKCWAGKALCSSDLALPQLHVSSIFPPIDISLPVSNGNMDKQQTFTTTTKVFVFNATNIAALKAKCASQDVQNPTRVEAVSALIWKCAVKASRTTSKAQKPSVLLQAVNLRGKALPPISEHCVGNLVGGFSIQTVEKNLDMQSLVIQLRKGKEDCVEKYSRSLHGEKVSSRILEIGMESGSLLSRGDIDLYIFSSWCNFDFYQVDFGWEKPTWMCTPTSMFKRTAVLMDTSDGKGVEAWVTLAEEDMALLECDMELIDFSS